MNELLQTILKSLHTKVITLEKRFNEREEKQNKLNEQIIEYFKSEEYLNVQKYKQDKLNNINDQITKEK